MNRPWSRCVGRRRVYPFVFPVCILMALIFFLPGCGFFGGGDKETASNTVKGSVTAGKKNAPKPAPVPAPEEEPPLTLELLKQRLNEKLSAYVFNPEGRVDPFMPIEAILASQIGKVSSEEAIALPPLQKMELSQIKLVAIVEAGEMTRALVEDSTGTGYIIQVGTKMGTNDGEVSAVQSESVEVSEQYKNYLGEVKTRVQVLKLRLKEGETQ
jgi:Tfp pilus assembly protein PilP